MSANELMGWGLMNLWSKGKEGAYIVCHRSKPATFPILFPHGQGGIVVNQPVAILHYHDRQFQTYEITKEISDPAVHMLQSYVQTTSGQVIGSDTSAVVDNYLSHPPSLWIIINLCNLHDPIAQVFTGEKIDIDAFEAAMGPNKDTRAKNIADDPYAAAKSFHFIIQVILHMLFGIHVTPYCVKSSKGIFGWVRSYFGAMRWRCY
ncbi:hypothetical protein F5876DRAFT_88555 [Lentinula aff. lateritia]|uniref:Uncharacterized protein n=1 Tax=Lentinula aff. lateritia TaxID=2804960 RepID=A0ACC1U2W3_9AGAR|nr:hypothetical protein F5876DRAFT_88555 [Lentinula aff. lateritia]